MRERAITWKPFRALLRVLLCAAMAAAVALSEFSAGPASAATAGDWAYYDSTDVVTSNTYDVSIYVSVTSSGSNRYTLSANMKGTCRRGRHSREPDMGLRFGSSTESWHYIERVCGSGAAGRTTTSYATVTGAGKLGSDRRVHFEAGAWGGRLFGTWGWGDRKIVTV